MPDEDTPGKSTRLGLLLVPGFALMGYAALVEAFRGANVLAGRRLYEWEHISPDGAAVEASNGARILADARVGDVLDCSVLFVFAGGDPRGFTDPATLAWLRLQSRRGATVAGVSGGPYVMARAGLLTGRRATIHWEHRPALREEFPDIALETGLYVMDGSIITCAGGTAGMDLALALIERDHGKELARKVSEWYIRTAPRDAAEPQRLSLAERYGTTNSAVLTVLRLLEGRIDQPPARKALACAASLSLRQLERLFIAEIGKSMSETGMAIRLDAAAHRLRATDVSVTAISLDCGFASSAHFTRRFRDRFGSPPSALRRG